MKAGRSAAGRAGALNLPSDCRIRNYRRGSARPQRLPPRSILKSRSAPIVVPVSVCTDHFGDMM